VQSQVGTKEEKDHALALINKQVEREGSLDNFLINMAKETSTLINYVKKYMQDNQGKIIIPPKIKETEKYKQKKREVLEIYGPEGYVSNNLIILFFNELYSTSKASPATVAEKANTRIASVSKDSVTLNASIKQLYDQYLQAVCYSHTH
jgi:hypothetical protein